MFCYIQFLNEQVLRYLNNIRSYDKLIFDLSTNTMIKLYYFKIRKNKKHIGSRSKIYLILSFNIWVDCRNLQYQNGLKNNMIILELLVFKSGKRYFLII